MTWLQQIGVWMLIFLGMCLFVVGACERAPADSFVKRAELLIVIMACWLGMIVAHYLFRK